VAEGKENELSYRRGCKPIKDYKILPILLLEDVRIFFLLSPLLGQNGNKLFPFQLLFQVFEFMFCETPSWVL